MSPFCLCGPRLQNKPQRLKPKSIKSVELQHIPVLPKELWDTILSLLPLHVLWRNARPTCRCWNEIVLDIVVKSILLSTVIDVQWRSPEKIVRQRLYPSIPRLLPESKPFSALARWILPTFEKSLSTSERHRYTCQNVIILLPSGKTWQNVASFVRTKTTPRTDIWQFKPLSKRGNEVDIFSKEFFDPSWVADWKVKFKKSDDTDGTTRMLMCLDQVSVPIAQAVKLIALAEDEDWPEIAKIDGFERRVRTRPNSRMSMPRRGSAAT